MERKLSGGRGFLKTYERARPLFAHRTLAAIGELVLHVQDLCSAIYVETEDARWLEAADALANARVWLRAPYDHVQRDEARRNLPTSVPVRSELGAAGRRDDVTGDRSGMELLDAFHRRRSKRSAR